MNRLHIWLISLAAASVLTTQASGTEIQHKIKKGDSLYTIAKANKTTVDKICQINGIKKNQTLKIGRVLKVSSSPKNNKIATTSTYKVKSGDALYTIAKKHHTNVAALKSLNGLKTNSLKIGQALKVPGAKPVKIAKAVTPKGDKKLAQTLSKLPNKTLAQKQPTKKEVFSLSNIFSTNGKSNPKCEKVIKVAKNKLGHKYVWGAVGKKGTFDCSGFTKYCYKETGIELPRTSINQSKYGKFVKKSELKKGDLIFFDTSKRRRGYVNHVGIYIGDNKFIHASSAKKQVVITSLDKSFYANRYMGARRPS